MSTGTFQSIVLANGRVLSVVAHAVFPPIPDNRGDWQAFDDRTYCGSGPLGVGATREAAIADLVEQICDAEDTCVPDCWCCQQEKSSPSPTQFETSCADEADVTASRNRDVGKSAPLACGGAALGGVRR